MAKYKEIWLSPIDSNIIGYLDTENQWSIPIDPQNGFYREFLTWQAAGGVADPAFTQEEIDQQILNEQILDAKNFLSNTDPIILKYRDELAFGRTPSMPESKYLNLLKKRARAQKMIPTEIPDY